ncbi:hypothetical protein LIP_2839 [Limnochorda pilosa]|uniref:N(6)-L-threonylcarbamoyladenine synthase n=1 Tax=Limnochorda pilosa TaxID=1555112 RepID=A0A0K2SNG9_LIMPI|nr:hypothetical protein LIP_2839 [Limnochorda pilosa]
MLGLESSGRLGGTAVAELRPGAAPALRAEHLAGVEATHSERLMPALERAMEAAGVDRGEVAAVAVTAGPGSYTGIRIGVMTAKALAFGWGLPLVPVLTLDALAWQAGAVADWVVPVLPARRGAYFGALYRAGRQGDPAGWEQPVPPGRWTPEELLRPLAGPGAEGRFCLVGEGAEGFHRWLETGAGAAFQARVVPEYWTLGHLRPGAVALLGAVRLAAGQAAKPMEVEPVYLRETEAERRAAGLEAHDGGKSGVVG